MLAVNPLLSLAAGYPADTHVGPWRFGEVCGPTGSLARKADVHQGPSPGTHCCHVFVVLAVVASAGIVAAQAVA